MGTDPFTVSVLAERPAKQESPSRQRSEKPEAGNGKQERRKERLVSDTSEPTAATAEGAADKPEAEEKAPFAIRKGDSVTYGHRKGRVKAVRGGGPIPYEVRIDWQGEKYPEWFQYLTLLSLYEKDQFKIG